MVGLPLESRICRAVILFMNDICLNVKALKLVIFVQPLD
jgi:hypothetical protein